MIHEYKYYICKSSWGIYIVINANILSKSDSNGDSEEVYPGLWISISHLEPEKGVRFIESDKKYLWEGFRRVGKNIIENSPYGETTLIILNYMVMTLSDYQDEGLTPAIIEWSASAFGFDKLEVDVEFNKENNKYEFHYPCDDN